MKKTFLLLVMAAVLSVGMVSCAKDEASDNSNQLPNVILVPSGRFSVSPSLQIQFAPGNLDYDESERNLLFTEHQYDYGAHFGWGTGDDPSKSSESFNDYPSFIEWGEDLPRWYHVKGGWRTLSHDEWHYVVFDRADADQKRAAATVCGVHGLVLLPDDWQNGGAFTAGFGGGWETNVYDSASWDTMQSSGVVFLPAAGYRYGQDIDDVGSIGYYWTSTPKDDHHASHASALVFDVGDVHDLLEFRSFGLSVRLVCHCTF